MVAKRSLCLCAALVLNVIPGATCTAGLNAGALAGLYWYSGIGTAGSSAQTWTTSPATLLVTAKGVSSIAGADCQILAEPADGGPMPDCWLGPSTGHCADTAGTVTWRYNAPIGGFENSRVLWGGWSPITSPATEYYQDPSNPCLTPHGTALIWFSGGLLTPLTRTTSTEYAVFAVSFDLSGTGGNFGTGCPGDLQHGARPVCFAANYRQPCDPAHQLGAVLGLTDANGDVDYVRFVNGHSMLAWMGKWDWGAHEFYCSPLAAPTTTWSHLRRLYR